MTFDELVAEVYTITNRPDLVNETISVLRAATLKAHSLDFFSRDLHQVELVFEDTLHLQSMDIYNNFTNYRALKMLKIYDKASGPEVGTLIDIVTPDELLDSYGVNLSDVGYVAGRSLNIRASCPFKYAIMLAYIYPIVTPIAAYSSWVADLQPWAIINEACRVLFKTIGYDEQSRAYEVLVAQEYQILKMTGLSDVGY